MDPRRYLDLFLIESREHVEQAHELHRRLRRSPGEATGWRELLRHAHSLKGMAATMGLEPMVLLAHALEELLADDGPVRRNTDDDAHTLLAESLDCLAQLIDRFELGDTGDLARVDDLATALRRLTGQQGLPATRPARTADDAEPGLGLGLGLGRTPASAWRIEATLAAEATLSAQATVRFLSQLASLGRVLEARPPMLASATGRFEGRLTLVLETSIPRASIEAELERSAEIVGWTLEPEVRQPDPPDEVDAATARWVRVRAATLDGLAEALLDLRSEQGALRTELGAVSTAVRQRLDRCDRRLRQLFAALDEMRLIPFQTVAHRLQRTVRELEEELGKSCRLEVTGDHVRLDRRVLDSLHEPLLHLVRNAISHGIETPDERIASGKPPSGLLRLSLVRCGDRVHVTLEDDGRGMDLDRIRQRAIEQGLLDADAATRLSDSETVWLTTHPGLSTVERVSRVSGRGIGMDVVRDRLESLGGLVEIETAAGRGTRVRLCVPPSVALVQTLLVRVGHESFAFPIDAIERTCDYREAREAAALSDWLGLDPGPRPTDATPTVLFRAPGGTLGLTVDEVLGRRDLVVTPLHAPIAALTRYSGAATLIDGSIVLVLDPIVLRRQHASN